ncbi:hypothetical protein JOQ06_019406 [Pogonophryne albipinna]|uniref:Uncharacterized protein n=1 Tax=Pogonophryne albipinna TaxID=1090488 RepID=A0AAD6FE30_9TELE|nr:hypothetical protein JOQ06_019406 [Pogonophryne albipinna]
MKVVSGWQSERRRGPQVTRPRLKGDAEQTEQPEGLAAAGGVWAPAAANLCTPAPPSTQPYSALVCQRGKRVGRPEPQGQMGYSI